MRSFWSRPKKEFFSRPELLLNFCLQNPDITKHCLGKHGQRRPRMGWEVPCLSLLFQAPPAWSRKGNPGFAGDPPPSCTSACVAISQP